MIDYRYIPTDLDEGSWGHELDRSWGPLFNPRAQRAFHADVFRVIGRDPPGPDDAGLCHSLAMPGESYAWRFAHLPAGEILGLETTAIASFCRVFTLSEYFRGVLMEHGLRNVAGVLLYPTPRIRPTDGVERRVVVAQRFSEEKMPLLVLALARRMPDVEFVFVHAHEPEGLYRIWLDLAGRNTSFRSFPSKTEYYQFLARSACGLVATFRDNFGVSALDCLAAGRPYVAPDGFAYRELIEDRLCLYEPYSLSDMERAVRHALAIPGHVRPPWTHEQALRQIARVLA